MRVFVAALLFLLGNAAALAEVVFPPGSAVGAEPVAGLVISRTFSGFEDRAVGASVVINMTAPREAYAQITAGFSDDTQLGRRGITADLREQATIGGRPALLMRGTQVLAGTLFRKWIVVIDAEFGTLLVTAQHPKDTPGPYSDAAMRKLLTGLVLRTPPSTAEQAAALPFAIKDLGQFRILVVMNGMLMGLTNGPKDVDPDYTQPHVMALSMPQVPAPEEREEFSRQAFLGQRALSIGEVETGQALTIGGLPAYELVARATSAGGVELRVAHWMIFTPTATLGMQAAARAPDFAGLLPQFHALRDGFTPR